MQARDILTLVLPVLVACRENQSSNTIAIKDAGISDAIVYHDVNSLDTVVDHSKIIADDYTKYAVFARRHGMVLQPDRALVIGVRGRTVAGVVHEVRVRRAYDDLLLVLTPDRRVIRLAASTHPWEIEGGEGVPDVDRDGRPDVGILRPGKYIAVQRGSKQNILGARTYQVLKSDRSDKLPGVRNTDHDDVYSPAEHAASEARGDTLTAILFHQGGAGAPKAVGCQVLDADNMRRLIAEVGVQFDYLLVDARLEDVP